MTNRYTSLASAAFSLNVEAVRELLGDACVVVDGEHPHGPSPLLTVCVRVGRPVEPDKAAKIVEIARMLLQAGASPDVVTHGGRTPLHHASYNSNAGLVELLLESGVDPRICDSDNMVASEMACDASIHQLFADYGHSQSMWRYRNTRLTPSLFRQALRYINRHRHAFPRKSRMRLPPHLADRIIGTPEDRLEVIASAQTPTSPQ